MGSLVYEEPRSATLQKYDKYKKMQEEKNETQQKKKSSRHLVSTVQLIHDVVDSIKKNNDVLIMNGDDEGNMVELE